ncbi:MAG: hypothetical protein MT490_05775 [Sphingomonas sp.]|uniref:hypothetical protein n=1 Tax=Sphingomonas sp. TaxID=28214 RepID=UPI0022730719|nr:hypothetical protein [Sphingomonas sp.]MCX8475290.1 hypothetical protein [Sphingomonas sp.]
MIIKSKFRAVAAFLTAATFFFNGSQAIGQDYNTAIFGHVHLPEGHHWRGTEVLLCPDSADTCDTEGIRVPVKGRDTLAVSAEFFKDGLDPSRRYMVVGHQDNDRDGNPTRGDLLGTVKNGEAGIFPGSSGVRIILSEVRNAPAVQASAPARTGGGAGAGALAGTWSRSASGSQLALRPELRLVERNGGMGADTRSVMRYGSANVRRQDRLSIQADGSFTWLIDEHKPYGSTCTMHVIQEKIGRATISGGKVTFMTNGGKASTTNSCTGRKDEMPTARIVETYDFNKSGARMTLSGTGGVNWVFTKS